MRDAEEIERLFDAEFSDSRKYDETKAYLSCLCQLAKEGCPTQDTLEGLAEEYRMAFRRSAARHNLALGFCLRGG